MSLSEREGVSRWVWGEEESPTAVPFERKRCRRVFVIREAGGRVLKRPWSVESSDNSSFGSSCLESSKLHVCVCIVWRWTCVYHTIKSALDLLSHVYHMLTSIWSRWSDIQSLLYQLWSMMFVWLVFPISYYSTLLCTLHKNLPLSSPLPSPISFPFF